MCCCIVKIFLDPLRHSLMLYIISRICNPNLDCLLFLQLFLVCVFPHVLASLCEIGSYSLLCESFFPNSSFRTNCLCQWDRNLVLVLTVRYLRSAWSSCREERRIVIYRAADKSLARPGRKQATVTKLYVLQATQNNSECCPSNQVSATSITSASDEKWRTFNFFLVGSS